MKLIDILKGEPFNMKVNDAKARVKTGTIQVNGLKVDEKFELDIQGNIEDFPEWFMGNFTTQQMQFFVFAYDNPETMFDKSEMFDEFIMNKIPKLHDVQYKEQLLKTAKGTYWILT